MTDNEIIKALECCLNADSKCADCHFSFERRFCKNALLKQTLNLINRQKIEIESLKIANEKMYVANKEQEAEIERLSHKIYVLKSENLFLLKSKGGLKMNKEVKHEIKQSILEEIKKYLEE